ncbi:MAG: carbamoyltransferase C-terminal domain-containing protein, partial [Myxococcota bacterium]
DMDFFGYLDDLQMTTDRFDTLFDGPPRTPESPVGRREMDLAASIQAVTNEVVLRMARHAREKTGKRHLCLAGGVALNCVANGLLLRAGVFDDIWIQPAAGDAGGAIGAALAVWHGEFENERRVEPGRDGMGSGLLGPEFSTGQIQEYLDAQRCVYKRLDDAEWADTIAALIAQENVVGLFQGRMEFGPRALGNRSIVGDPRSERMQSTMNRKIKFRENFRPFAPACLADRIAEVFELDRPSPYMLLVAPVRADRCVPRVGDERDLDLHEWVNRRRSDLPAITHVDHSARIQSVSASSNPRFHALLRAFDELTGCPVLINTSFNVRDEPIVCTPEDAYHCFMRTEMDHLAVGPFLLAKEDQPQAQQSDWARTPVGRAEPID